ncbi:uncharacterized protein TRUGW13939_05127 [Talaromyces rugulosus]|uniref:Uncharacterized protein n=1 Tax=Talaromyces rugulosus TaxID=121627 RepID=A0A7H8QVL0_TALRU|nr:uncharacterized protein TRUGW13939_05127 [Talaromyces rugulosus]QKX58007.1 hypothetical protein TRUGW13939_05127 [Talaromyces rugulosus]
MQKNKGKYNEFKMAGELHEAQLKLHQVQEEVYAWEAFMKAPDSKTLEEPSVDTELQFRIQQKYKEMKPPLSTLKEPEATPEEKDTCAAKVKDLCDEMCSIVFQSPPEPKVFEPDPNFKPTGLRQNAAAPTDDDYKRHEEIASTEIAELDI